MSCFNCKSKKKFDEAIVLDKKTKEGICLICSESLDINTINIKVLIHIQEESSSKSGNKCIFCNKKTSQIPNMCSIHFCCYDCVIDPDAFMSNFHHDLIKCLNWMKLALMQCKSCFQELNVDDRFYVFTCNSHFYCKNCILSKRFYCKICLGVDEIPKTKNKYLKRILLKVRTLKVLLHDNHISNYEIFYASDINSGINCERCKTIILEVRKLIELKSIKACNVSDCGFMILEPIISLSNALNDLQNYYNQPYPQEIQIESQINYPNAQDFPNYSAQNSFQSIRIDGIHSIENKKIIKEQPYNENYVDMSKYSALIQYIQNKNIQSKRKSEGCFLEKFNAGSKLSGSGIANQFCLNHMTVMLDLECGHLVCIKSISETFKKDLDLFCYQFKYYIASLKHREEFCIRCNYENCFNKHLFSCRIFEDEINLIFEKYQIEPFYREYIKLYFDGRKEILDILVSLV